MIEQAPGALVQHVGGYVLGVGVAHEVEQGARLDGGPIVVAMRLRPCSLYNRISFRLTDWSG